jgi:hypothetical protein
MAFIVNFQLVYTTVDPDYAGDTVCGIGPVSKALTYTRVAALASPDIKDVSQPNEL